MASTAHRNRARRGAPPPPNRRGAVPTAAKALLASTPNVGATATPSGKAVVGAKAVASPARTATGPKVTPRPASRPTPPPALASDQPVRAVAPAEPPTPGKAPSRLGRALDNIASVQAPPDPHKPRPRWFTIGTWLVMLMPVYSILIIIIGFLYFLPAELKGVGLNASLGDTPTATVNNVLVPDQEGVFLQHATAGKVVLDQILQFNSTSLQPPQNQQMVLAPTDLRYIVIRQAQVETPDNYIVTRIDHNLNQSITVTGQRLPTPGLAVIALSLPNGQAWAPGSYEITVPESGLDSNDYWCFFTIVAPGK